MSNPTVVCKKYGFSCDCTKHARASRTATEKWLRAHCPSSRCDLQYRPDGPTPVVDAWFLELDAAHAHG